METMSCGNLTDFCINCYQDTGRHNTIYTVLASCLCYIAGILSVIMVIFIRKLKKRKLWCFKEKEEPFKGKWEGASQRATIQVLKKHTLEQGSSLEKSMKLESSVEVKNELDDSGKHSGKTTSNDKLDLEKSEEKHNDDANTDERKIKNARPDLSKETDSLEASVQRSDKSEENPNTEIKSKLEGTDTLKSNGDQDVDKSLDTDNGQVEQDKEVLTVKREAQESHKASTRDNDRADDVEKSGKLEIDITEDGKVTGDAIKDAGNETDDKGDSPVVVNEGEKEVPLIGEVKGDNSVADGVKEKVPVIDGGKLKVPVIGEVKEDVPVIVCDSTGAELYEKGRESSMYDHDDLIVQNDNFRISQLSAN